MMPQMLMLSTFGVGLTTAGAGVAQLILPPANVLQGLPCVIVSLPMMMLTWYLWAVNDIVLKIQATPGAPAQKLAEVKGVLEPILVLLKIMGNKPATGA
jgi:hypothetical protein